MKRTSWDVKDLNMTTARKIVCQSKEKLTTRTAVAEKRKSTRRPGAAQDWPWARSKTIRGRHQDDPTRNRPTRGPITGHCPRGKLPSSRPTRGPIARNCPCGTLSPSRSKWETNELLHVGAHHGKLSTRDIHKRFAPRGGQQREVDHTRHI